MAPGDSGTAPPNVLKVMGWALRSPLRTFLAVTGALIAIVALTFLSVYAKLRWIWLDSPSISNSRVLEIAGAISAFLLLLIFIVAAWSARRWRSRRAR